MAKEGEKVAYRESSSKGDALDCTRAFPIVGECVEGCSVTVVFEGSVKSSDELGEVMKLLLGVLESGALIHTSRIAPLPAVDDSQ